MSHSFTKIDQKEYLKKYLSGDKAKKKKKDKKHKKSSVGSVKVKIIDDDINHLDNGPKIDEELLLIGDDAPQIVGEYIEEQADNKLPRWKSIVIKDEPDDESDVRQQNDADLWGQKANGIRVKHELTPDHSPPRRKYETSGRYTSPNRNNFHKSANSERNESAAKYRTKNRSPDCTYKIKAEPQSLQKRYNTSDASPPQRRNSDLSPPRKGKSASSRASCQSPIRRRKYSDQSPPRRRKSPTQSPPRRRIKDSDYSPSRRHNPDKNNSTYKSNERLNKIKVEPLSPQNRQSKRADGSNQYSTRRRNSDLSPSRRGSFKSPDQLPPRRRRRDSDQSPLRRHRNSDQSSSRRGERSSKSLDQSPARRRRRDSDQSPLRRHRNSDQSSSRRGERSFKSPDQSPPSRKRRDSDQSPLRRHRTSGRNSVDLSARKGKQRRETPESSPLRKYRKNTDESSPGTRYNLTKAASQKSRLSCSPHKSPSRHRNSSPNLKRRENRSQNNLSPNPRRSRWEKQQSERSFSPPPSHKPKPSTTLDGKKSGLQDAKALRKETTERRKQEDILFDTMSKDISGRDADVQVRSTGRKGHRGRTAADEDPAERKRKDEHEQKKKLLYDRWGKGLKQIEDYKNRMVDEQYESSKPLARYSNDEDLERHLKEQERAEDPMLEYMRQKRKEKEKKSGKPEVPRYEGTYPENRFSIRPGYRWDGVDRSNGYEKKYFTLQNEKLAIQDEAYKYSVEDM